MKNLMILISVMVIALFSCSSNNSSESPKMFPLNDSASNVQQTTVVETGSAASQQTTSAGTSQAAAGNTTAVTDATQSTEGNTTQPTITDVNTDTSSTSGFQFATVTNVEFSVNLLNSSQMPVVKAVISLRENNNEISTSVTDDTGKAIFKVSISTTTTSLEMVINHPDYTGKSISIDNIQNLSAVSRMIYLENKNISGNSQAPAVKDSDNDGVPDDIDQYPNDNTLIAAVYNEYTVAFEDLYPNKGDADFNDLVVKFGITEYINPENKISKINIKSKVLASGAGYTNQFWISILGKEYLLVKDPHADLNKSWNTRSGEKFINSPVHSLDLVFENPVSRTDIASMPYDPFIKINGSETNQVHLPFVKTAFIGKTLDRDKFPWAVLVPNEWLWPLEGSQNMFKAYPDFKKWYESDGADYRDWYLRPDKTYTFPVPGDSMLTAYILRLYAGKNNLIIGIIASVVLLVIVVLNIRSRRHSR